MRLDAAIVGLTLHDHVLAIADQPRCVLQQSGVALWSTVLEGKLGKTGSGAIPELELIRLIGLEGCIPNIIECRILENLKSLIQVS